MKKILITGGAGFIGKKLAQVLINADFEVRIFDNLSAQIHGDVPVALEWLCDKNIEFVRGSVTEKNDILMAIKNVDCVVHLAAETGTGQSMYEIEKYNKTNVLGTSVLLDVLANDKSHNVKKIILASSRSVYGEGAYICKTCSPDLRVFPKPRPAEQLSKHLWEPLCIKCGSELEAIATNEDDAVRPASIYAATKFAQEDLVRIACDALGIEYAILRLQNVYGEGQSLNNPYTGILSIFSTKIRRGLDLPIFEDGLESRDFVHVEDVTRAILMCVLTERRINQVINVGSGVGTSVYEVASKLISVFGASKVSNIKITSEYRIGDIRHNFADTNKLCDLLSACPTINLEDGLHRFASWVLTQPLPEDRLSIANNELKMRKLMA